MISLDQLLKLAGNLPLDKLSQYLSLDKLTGALQLDKLAENASAKAEELKHRERMSSVDTAWLRMDTPTNLMMIVGVMMFDGVIDAARFKRTLEARLLRYARFRQRVDQDPSGAYWVDDLNFDIDNHVQVVNLPVPGGKEALEQYVASLSSQALDANKPLWQMTLVQSYHGDGVAGCAVIIRIHHCIADGISLIGVMYSLTDSEADAPESGVEPEALRRARERKAARAGAGERDFLSSLFEPLGTAATKTMAMYGDIWNKSIEIASHPEKSAEEFAGYAKVAADATAQLAELALLPADSDTSFKGKPGAIKRVAWSAPLPLTEIKAVCQVLGVSVNDVLLSSVAGAMRSYLDERGEADAATEVRGFVPVNLRARGDEHKLGNRFGMVALALPVGVADPFERVFEVKRRMDELKNSYQAALSMGILTTVGLLPRTLQKQVLDIFSAKGSAVMTNVPGPQQPLYLAGRRLAQQMFWVPQSGDIGIGVSILSYNGQVQFGLVTDRKFVPEPARIVDRFAGEFNQLLFTLLLEGRAPRAPESRAPRAPEPRRAPHAVEPKRTAASPTRKRAAKQAVVKKPAAKKSTAGVKAQPVSVRPGPVAAPRKAASATKPPQAGTTARKPAAPAVTAPAPSKLPGLKKRGLLRQARAL